METATASVLVGAFILLFLARGKTPRKRFLRAAIVITGAVAVKSVDFIFRTVDDLLGGYDYIHLLSGITMLLGVHILTLALASLAEWTPPSRRLMWGVMTVAAIGLVISFWQVPSRHTSVMNLMGGYGENLAAASFAVVLHAVLAYVSLALFATTRSIVSRHDDTGDWVAGILLYVAALTCLTVCGAALIGNLAALFDWHGVTTAAISFYNAAAWVTCIALALGLVASPVIHWVSDTRRARAIAAHLSALTPLWNTATSRRPSLQLEVRRTPSEARLHRRLVEIYDAALDPRSGFRLSREETAQMAAAERVLRGERAPAAAAT
ncbi:DUF6545 domain-containing protein [Microbacterium sp. 77mftsu3.1]|uniref:DUF6545 domain-containing protein n=1 Tax=Microbacterium sp. 77mftsu3.1 TaxID=1761802 RepID=UPI00037BC307|nr:DUF6545 domain-containing protein [Microbacterium sp. 77mftsu3.1]SDH42263.1 hypothetical protein SAMN04488590_3302 [Microbacterium sp. 77mftsu3.1]